MYKLTVEGKHYLQNGLPEIILIKKVAGGENNLSNLKSVENFPIALAWAKKNGWVKIAGNTVELADKGMKALAEKGDAEKALADIENRKVVFNEIAKILLSRKLIEEVKDRKEINITEVTELTPEIIRTGAWKEKPFRKYDINAPAPPTFLGKKQAYRAFLDDVKMELVGLGFEEMIGSPIELSFFNNDALFMPQDHPARGIHDLFFIKNPQHGNIGKKHENFLLNVKAVQQNGWKTGSTGWGGEFSERASSRLVLRSQTTALSARWLMKPELKIPGAYFAIGRVYRPEKLDQTHLMEFNQVEGIVLGEDANFRKLLGLLKEFAKKIVGTDKVKFKPGYFPFTEPSVECYVWSEQRKKWLEILGAGIFRPEVTLPLGVKVPVLAWGIGLDRLFMLREGLSDIRQLFSQDINWLRSAKILSM